MESPDVSPTTAAAGGGLGERRRRPARRLEPTAPLRGGVALLTSRADLCGLTSRADKGSNLTLQIRSVSEV